MSEIKATSFRISEEDVDKFKLFMEKEGIKTQADGFKAVMQSIEMAQAKNLIKDRAKEIEVFQDTVNNLMGMFLNSLTVNQTSEERIREELSRELEIKDNTLSTLYEQVQEEKSKVKVLDDSNKDLTKSINLANNEVVKLQEDIQDKQIQLDIANRNNSTLQEQLAEYKEYKENYKTLEVELVQLKSKHANIIESSTKLIYDKELLNSRLKNNLEMIEFYKLSNEDLKSSTREVEMKCNKQVSDITQQLKSINDLVLEKKELESLKLRNKIEDLNKTVEILNNKLKERESKKTGIPKHQRNSISSSDNKQVNTTNK